MIKLVLSDMDNTLIPVGEDHVSYRTVTAIRDLLDVGVRFAPATGREVYELDRMFFGVRDCYQTALAANGKRVYVDGRMVSETLMDREALLRLQDLLDTTPNAFLVVEPADNPRGKKPWLCVGAREGDAAWFAQRLGFLHKTVERLPEQDFIAAEIACAGSDEQYERILAQACELLPGYSFTTSQVHWCDVLPEGVGKGSSIQTLLDELGIRSDEVLFFGDADNDIELMQAVEHSVAVANATDTAYEVARWHVGPCEDDGVAVALEQLAEALEAGEKPRFMQGQGEDWSSVRAALDDEDDVLLEDELLPIRELLAAHLAPELGGEAGTMSGTGADAHQFAPMCEDLEPQEDE